MIKKIVFILLCALAVYAQQVIKTLDTPADSIVGLGISDGGNTLWAVSKNEAKVYKIDLHTAEVLFSFDLEYQNETPPFKACGLTYTQNMVHVAQWNGKISGGWANYHKDDGEFVGRCSVFC